MYICEIFCKIHNRFCLSVTKVRVPQFWSNQAYMYSSKQHCLLMSTGPQNGFDTLTNCIKVEHDKIWKYIAKTIWNWRKNIFSSSLLWDIQILRFLPYKVEPKLTCFIVKIGFFLFPDPMRGHIQKLINFFFLKGLWRRKNISGTLRFSLFQRYFL